MNKLFNEMALDAMEELGLPEDEALRELEEFADLQNDFFSARDREFENIGGYQHYE